MKGVVAFFLKAITPPRMHASPIPPSSALFCVNGILAPRARAAELAAVVMATRRVCRILGVAPCMRVFCEAVSHGVACRRAQVSTRKAPLQATWRRF